MATKCSSGHENPDGSAFCDECGEPLTGASAVAAPATNAEEKDSAQLCPSCGAANPVSETFCSECGGSLLGSPVPVLPAQQTPTPVVEEQEVVQPAPVAVSHPRLIVEDDHQEFDLSGRDSVMIGRQDIDSFPDIDLLPHGADEGGVSREHARLFVENGQYMLEDRRSMNFTFVNRQRLAPATPTPLHDNDEIRCGRVRLRFKLS